MAFGKQGDKDLISPALYEATGMKSALSPQARADAFNLAFNLTAKDGLNDVIAYAEVSDHYDIPDAEFEDFIVPALEFGVGKQNFAWRLQQTKMYDQASRGFVPTDVKKIEYLSTTSEGKYMTVIENDRLDEELRRASKNAEVYGALVEANTKIIAAAKKKEKRETLRYIFGCPVEDKDLDAKIKANWKSFKDTINQNKRNGVAKTGDPIAIVKEMQALVDVINNRSANEYNLGLVNGTGNLNVNGVDTNVAPIDQYWNKEDRICIANIKFKRALQAALAEVRHPEMLPEFESLFKKVIWTDLDDAEGVYSFRIIDPRSVNVSMGNDENSNEYFPNNKIHHFIHTHEFWMLMDPTYNNVIFTFNK